MLGSPNKSMELAASLKEMKASDTPPARTEDGSVLVVSENGHSNGPLSEVRTCPCRKEGTNDDFGW